MEGYLIVRLCSLKYLLGNSPKTYKESEYIEKAQHSALHHNKEVSDEIINFYGNSKL